MAPDTKVTRLGAIVEDLRRKVTQLEEQVKPSTPLQVIEERREVAIEAAKKIEETEMICAKVVDKVSQTWEPLMDDEQSKKIANEMTSIKPNNTQIMNDMKELPLAQKMDKAMEMRKLQQ